MLCPVVSYGSRRSHRHLLTGMIDEGLKRATSLPAAFAVGTGALSGDVLRLAMATEVPQQGTPAAVFTMTSHRMSSTCC